MALLDHEPALDGLTARRTADGDALQALLLHHLEDEAPEELAASYGVPVGPYQRLGRAYKP